MIAAIQQLRAMIEVPISEAKDLLIKCHGDVQAAYDLALDQRITPIVIATGLDRNKVQDAFLKNGLNADKTVEYLRYMNDPVAFEESRRPKVSELRAAIEKADGVYSILEACDSYDSLELDELSQFPQVIQDLLCLGVFYSLYHTDTDALLRYYPAEYHGKIVHALRAIGHSSIADRYLQDVEAIEQSHENFTAFLDEQEAFTDSLRDYCLSHLENIFAWQMKRNAEAEQAALKVSAKI